MKDLYNKYSHITLVFLISFVVEFACIFYIPVKNLRYSRKKSKLLTIAVYLSIILSAIYSRIVFGVIAGLILIVSAYMALKLTFYDFSEKQKAQGLTENPYFEGMSQKKAKKEYKKLMEKYDPEKESGNLEKLISVTSAYSQYCRSDQH